MAQTASQWSDWVITTVSSPGGGPNNSYWSEWVQATVYKSSTGNESSPSDWTPWATATVYNSGPQYGRSDWGAWVATTVSTPTTLGWWFDDGTEWHYVNSDIYFDTGTEIIPVVLVV